MNENWNQEPVGGRKYGSGGFGDFYFGSIKWNSLITQSATYAKQTDVSSTWTLSSLATTATWSENTINTSNWTKQ